jgi:hypothetical protein
MINMRIVIALLSVIIILYSKLGMATPLPEGPLVASVPNSCRYEMTFVSALDVVRKKLEELNPDAPKPVRRHSHRIVKWVVAKTDQTAVVETTDEGGQVGEFWVIDGALITKERNSDNYWAILAHEAQEIGEISFAGDSFPHTQWIAKEYFRGKKKLNGKSVLEFSTTIPEGEGGANSEGIGNSAANKKLKALIDEESRLPLTVEINGDTYEFRHLAAPNQKISPTNLVMEASRREAERQRALNTPPPPP